MWPILTFIAPPIASQAQHKDRLPRGSSISGLTSLALRCLIVSCPRRNDMCQIPPLRLPLRHNHGVRATPQLGSFAWRLQAPTRAAPRRNEILLTLPLRHSHCATIIAERQPTSCTGAPGASWPHRELPPGAMECAKSRHCACHRATSTAPPT